MDDDVGWVEWKSTTFEFELTRQVKEFHPILRSAMLGYGYGWVWFGCGMEKQLCLLTTFEFELTRQVKKSLPFPILQVQAMYTKTKTNGMDDVYCECGEWLLLLLLADMNETDKLS